MRSRGGKLSSDKIECNHLPAKKSLHIHFEIKSVLLGNIPVQLSNSGQNLGFIFDNQLILNEEINNVKRKVIINLINVSRIAKFIDNDSKIKLVHGLVFFYN